MKNNYTEQPLFIRGSKCISVSDENRLNRNLFIGRTVHLTTQLFLPLADQNTKEELLNQIKIWCGLASYRAKSSILVKDATIPAEIISLWYKIEMELLDRPINNHWVDQAKELLAYFISLDYNVPLSNLNLEYKFTPIEFIEWLDTSNSGGPSGEILCYMNPFIRKAGFIYNSPFDVILKLRQETIYKKYSQSTFLDQRSLMPPPSTE